MVEELRDTPPPDPEAGEPISVEGRLGALAVTLGLPETDEMGKIRDSLRTHDVGDREGIIEMIGTYQTLGQQEADKKPVDNPRPQIGVFVSSARAYNNVAGMEGDFIDTIYDAITYAQGMGYDEIVTELESFLPQEEEQQ